MPTVQPPAKVLVSGANGFIAIWVVKALLDQGYAVRGTVRSLEKGNHLKKVFEKNGDKFELVVVRDIGEEGAFDEAMKGIDAIEHVASPAHFKADDPEEIIRPAVDGTIGILKSAKKNGDSVKRIVITSSIYAALRVEATPVVLTEEDWGDTFVELVEKYGKDASNEAKYAASKNLAEKAAWEFYSANKDSISWDMVIFNPPCVFGPPLHEVSSLPKLNHSSLAWYNIVVQRSASAERPGDVQIDVRDLAELHARALSTEGAEGERYLVGAGDFEWQQFRDAVDGRPLSTAVFEPVNTIDTSKSQQMFNFRHRTLEETAKDTIEEYKRRGWVSG